MLSLTDIQGYLVSVPIPWDKRGRLLKDLFQGAIQKLLNEGCDGMYLFGTSGEGYAVTDDEFVQIINIFSEETKSFKGFRQIGCFGLSSEQVKRRCAFVTDPGIEAVQITLPFWKELSDTELIRYFEDVCGSFPSLSFLLYNNPRDKRKLCGKELATIQKHASNLHGAKTVSGNWLDFVELLSAAPHLRHFVAEPAFLFCHKLGAAGLIPSGNYARPRTTRKYYEAVISNELQTARDLHLDILRFFHRTAGPLLTRGYIDGAIDKAYARIGGMEIPLNMKSPYSPLSQDDFKWLEKIILSEFPD